MFQPDNKFMKANNIPHTIRFPDEMYDDLQTIHRRTGISFNSLILQCCKYALENLDLDGLGPANNHGSNRT